MSVLNCASQVGVVGQGVRPRMRLGDALIPEQERDWPGAHPAAAVGMECQLIAGDLLLGRGSRRSVAEASVAVARYWTVPPTT